MLETISKKKAILDSLTMSAENERRLWKKFALEWNYHSNHIEGNTLTYGETELLLVHGQVTGTHDLREIEEMKAHDLAIQNVREMAKERRPLTESDVRNLNQILLKEPFWKPAITADGQPTRSEIIPGQYKMQPNNVRLADGDIFQFTDPADVPFRMEKLVAWINRELSIPTKHPLEIATRVHHEFVLIHPFGDGNGRTARLLVNYILLIFGYPPLIVRTEKKKEYFAALRQADAGDLLPLLELLGKELSWALEISIQAARGDSIEEEGDLDKEIAIFVKNQTSEKVPEPEVTREVLMEVFEKSLKPLVEGLERELEVFDELFSRKSPRKSHELGEIAVSLEKFCHSGKYGEKIMPINWKESKSARHSQYYLHQCLKLVFTPKSYIFSILNPENRKVTSIQKNYEQVISPEERREFIKAVKEDTYLKLQKAIRSAELS